MILLQISFVECCSVPSSTFFQLGLKSYIFNVDVTDRRNCLLLTRVRNKSSSRYICFKVISFVLLCQYASIIYGWNVEVGRPSSKSMDSRWGLVGHTGFGSWFSRSFYQDWLRIAAHHWVQVLAADFLSTAELVLYLDPSGITIISSITSPHSMQLLKSTDRFQPFNVHGVLEWFCER